MIHKFTLIACALFSGIAVAGTGADSNAASVEQEASVLIASNQSTLTYAALNTSKGMSHVREFHDMGASGVQQIDYVVNCTNQTMAMSSFQILTAPGNLPVGFVSTPSKDLSFYKPVIEHDKQIARNVCEKQMAMNGYASGN
jgi:hypothetical protein